MLNRRNKASISIDQALTDKLLLGAALGDPASWSLWIASGVLATAKSGPVALLTLMSVAWAERMTAINNSKCEL